MPSIFFWKRKRKRSKKKDDKSTNTTTDDTATQPPAGDSNNTAITKQALPSVPQPVIDASSSGNESDNTEPGYSIVSHNKTITSSDKGVTPVVTQQQSSTIVVNDDKLREKNSTLHNDSSHAAVSDKENSQSIFDVDPEQLYSKVVGKKERQQKSVTQSQSEYSFLQHKKVNADDMSNVQLPVCSPQLYSILDSPHRTVSTSAGHVTKHPSIDFTAPPPPPPPAAAAVTTVKQSYNISSSDSLYDSSDDEYHHKSHQRQKPFQPIVYLPPKSSSKKKHGSDKKKMKRHHRHHDSAMVATSHSASSNRLRKNEFLVQGATLDGSVTLYAASPVGSALPVDQASPILNRLSSRPSSRQDHSTVSYTEHAALISQPLSHIHPHQSLEHQPSSLEQPMNTTNMMQQQQWTTPVTTTNITQPISTSASLTTSVDLPKYQGQKSSNSSPIAVNLDHFDQHQSQNANSRPVSANLDQHQNQNSINNHSSLTDSNNTGHGTHHDHQSLYHDMLDLMQKRETVIKQQVNTITADNERLQAKYKLLQQENDSSREAIPALQSQVSSLQVENQMLQLTIEKLNEELSNVQLKSQTHSLVYSSNDSKISDLTDTNNEGQMVSQDQPKLNSAVNNLPNKQQPSLVADTHSLGLSDNNSSWSKTTDHYHKSPVEENVILVKELQRQQELIKEMQQDHKFELSKMSRKLQRAYHDRDSLIETLAEMEKKQKHLQEKLSMANETISHQISLHEHQQSVKELQQMLDELMATHETVTTAQADKLKSLKREKKSLTSKLAEAKNIIVELESQCTGLHKANRKLKEEVDKLQENLEISRDRENFVHNELSRATMKAEKTVVERDALAQLAHSQQKTTERVVEKRKRDKSTIKHLKRKLNQPQPTTGEVITADDVDYTDQELARQQEHCQEAIKHIRLLEKSKQEELLKTTTGSVRNAERHLDKLWKATVTPNDLHSIVQ